MKNNLAMLFKPGRFILLFLVFTLFFNLPFSVFNYQYSISSYSVYSQTTEKEKAKKKKKKDKEKKKKLEEEQDIQQPSPDTLQTVEEPKGEKQGTDEEQQDKKIEQKKSETVIQKSEIKIPKLSERTADNVCEEEESMSGTVEWKVSLTDDNGNVKLPERYRTWWYIRLDGVNKNRISTLYIEGDGFQGGTVVLPVYSYDNKYWHRMKPEDIERGEEKAGLYNYAIKKKFDSSTVWIARYYPYSYTRLKNLLKKYEKNPFAKIETIGLTTHGRPIPMVTITDPNVDDRNKVRVWIHARTHPSESGGSFVIEGLIETLLSDCNIDCKKADLSKLIFHIVPMLNIDGVVEGNARVSPETSYDLERMWLRRPDNTYLLQDTVPPEIKAIHSSITKFDTKGPKFFMALNIHAKNAFPKTHSFIYTNFKEKNKEYGSNGDIMFFKQISFIKILSDLYCGDTLHIVPGFEIAQTMDEKRFPESWWWLNFQDSVMAATLETTSGINGCFEEWVTWQDHKKLGESLAEAIQKYYNYFIAKKWFRYEAPETDMENLMKFYKVNGN